MLKDDSSTSTVKKLELFSKEWFEMQDFPRFILNKKVWVPLRLSETSTEGRYGYAGYGEIFFGLGSIAIPVKDKAAAEKLNWQDIGISHSHSGYFDEGDKVYIPAEQYQHYPGDLHGLNLVLEVPGNGLEESQWEPNQDFVVTLGLIREGDIWLSPSEGYIEVVKLTRDEMGRPTRLEVKADHLTDYLSARDMGLLATFYSSRQACFESDPKMGWESNKKNSQDRENGRWEGREWPIHEGGNPFGEKMAVFHVGRTDVDGSEDIPDISPAPTDENTKSDSWEKGFEGNKLYKVIGEIWGNEWLDPEKLSKRVKGDKVPSSSYFAIDERGAKVSGDALVDSGKWLWFKPDVVMALVDRRGGSLKWFTKETGQIACSPHYGVHFGINKLGLVNIYAHDIGMLPGWQQQIWVGYNVSSEGGVSTELLDSQVRAEPAGTHAPEQFLTYGIKAANHFAQENLNITLFNQHEALPEILKRTHRFRAVDKTGLLALAKDIARVTAESLNKSGIQSLAKPPKDDWGSLKSLEFLLATKVGNDKAREIMTPLVMVNELRQGDAHLPSNEIDEAFSLLRINQKSPFVDQGRQMLNAVVSSLYKVIGVLKTWNK